MLVDTVPKPVQIAADHGVQAWSRFDAATKRYRLVIRRDGKVTEAAVADAKEEFDVDLGSDARDRLTAVYSRDDGDLYAYDVTAGQERKLAAASSSAHVDSLPALWHGRLAWARAGSVFWRKLGQGGRSRRIPSPGGRGGFTGLDLRGGRIVVSGDRRVPPEGEYGSKLWLLSVRGAPVRLIAINRWGESVHAIVSPQLSGGRIRYAISSDDEGGFSGLLQRDYRGGSRRRVSGSPVASVAFDGDTLARVREEAQNVECGAKGCAVEVVANPF